MKPYVKKKNDQLGMNFSTAQNRLRKDLLFSLVQRLGDDICYRCGEKIVSKEELSIEHKVDWLDSEHPSKLFFDLDNITFSHLSCNTRASRNPNKGKFTHNYTGYRRGCRCSVCVDAHAEKYADSPRNKNGGFVGSGRSKVYKLTAPEGEVLLIENLSRFASENNLDVQKLYKLFSGKKKSYKGYTV